MVEAAEPQWNGGMVNGVGFSAPLYNSLNPSFKKREVGALLPLFLPLFVKERVGSNPEPVEGGELFIKMRLKLIKKNWTCNSVYLD